MKYSQTSIAKDIAHISSKIERKPAGTELARFQGEWKIQCKLLGKGAHELSNPGVSPMNHMINLPGKTGPPGQ